jgi:pilus assembly protein CpaB
MNQRNVLMLIISLALALAVAFYANHWMTGRMEASLVGHVEVVAAAVEIPFGTKIEGSMIKLIQLPPDSLPAGAFKDPQQVVGRVTIAPFVKGEPIVEKRVVEIVGDNTLASLVEDGKRAYTLQTSNLIGPAGFIQAGNRVDLIGPARRADGTVENRTFLRHLKVLALDPPPAPDQKGMMSVHALTLEATPSQIEKIMGAAQAGNIQVTPRNPLEKYDPASDKEPQESEPKAELPPPAAPASGGQVPQPGTQPAAPTCPPPDKPPEEHKPETVLVIRGSRGGGIMVEAQPTGTDLANVYVPRQSGITPLPGAALNAMPLTTPADPLSQGANALMESKSMIDKANNALKEVFSGTQSEPPQ